MIVKVLHLVLNTSGKHIVFPYCSVSGKSGSISNQAAGWEYDINQASVIGVGAGGVASSSLGLLPIGFLRSWLTKTRSLTIRRFRY